MYLFIMTALSLTVTAVIYGQTATDANKRGLAAFKQKDYDNAIIEFTEAINLSPNDAVLYYNRGEAYYYKDEWDNAIRDYTKAIQLNPNDADYYVSRGWAYHNKNDKDNAIADANSAKRLEPENKSANDLYDSINKEGKIIFWWFLGVFIFIAPIVGFNIYITTTKRKKIKLMMSDNRLKNAKLFNSHIYRAVAVSPDGFIGVIQFKGIKIFHIKEIAGFYINLDDNKIKNDTEGILFNNIISKIEPYLNIPIRNISLFLTIVNNNAPVEASLLLGNSSKEREEPYYVGKKTQDMIKEFLSELERVEKRVKNA